MKVIDLTLFSSGSAKCFRCDKIINNDKAWTNDTILICFKCSFNTKEMEQYLNDLKQEREKS
jgi:Zn ribbon nucleic-acid-binding protein